MNIQLKKGTDALFLEWKDPNHFWILGKTIEDSYILIMQNKKYLLKSPLSNPKAEGFTITDYSEDVLKKLLLKHNVKNIGINFEQLPIKYKDLFKEINMIDISDYLKDLRLIKTKDEINKIKIACEHTKKCYELIISNLRKQKYKYEKDIVHETKRYALENNLGLSFEPIIASGANACIPHHDNSGIFNNGFCIIDLGFSHGGYNSDMSRTIYIGNPGKQDIILYNKILKIQEELINSSKPNTKCLSLYKKSLDMLGDLKKYFVHGLGHGLGVEIHEEPKINQKSDMVLTKNMIITIEPGVYIKSKGIGIRIEDTIVVDNKPLILTNASKELVIISLISDIVIFSNDVFSLYIVLLGVVVYCFLVLCLCLPFLQVFFLLIACVD